MKLTLTAFACFLLGAALTIGISDAAAQNRTVTPEMIRQAQAAGYNPDLREGLEKLEKSQGTAGTTSGTSSGTKGSTTTPQTNRTRNDADPKNLEYNRRNNGVETRDSEYLRRQEAQNDYRVRTVRDQAGNLVDAATGEIFETKDGQLTSAGQQNRLPGGSSSATGYYEDSRMTADGRLTPEEQERLRQVEKHIKDSILQNSVFGREIFSSRNLTFAPTYSLPTPSNYVLAGGDKIIIDLWGEAEATYDLKVSPDGAVVIPNAGVIQIGGLTVESAQNRIRSKMQQSVSGLADGSVQLKLSLGDIRSIKVEIIGEASMPGTYTLPSLATLFNALYEAGGVSDIGSLRSIRLIRNGKQIADLDVYEYLLEGKQHVNVGLHDNDLIVVQPYQNLVKVTGKVKRPRIYELKRNETAKTLLDYTGGFRGEAYTENISVARKSGRMYSFHTVQAEDFHQFTMADGDSVAIGEVIRQYANRVTIEGAVWRPGDYELSDGARTLKELITRAEGIRGDALKSRTQIVRLNANYSFQVMAIDLDGLLAGTVADIPLQPEDLVRIPSVNSLHEGFILEVKGEVNTPGTLLFREGMTVEDAILMADGLKESASLARIEVARRVKTPSSTTASDRIADIFQFTIDADLSISPETADFKLSPFDEIYIRQSPGYSKQQNVFADGEFLFVGEYALTTNNYRLANLVKQAGGLSPEAYAKGAYLKRKITRDRLNRMQSLYDLSERGKMATGDTILAKRFHLGDYYPIAIDLLTALKDSSSTENLVMEEGDRLVIPKFNSTVTISGSVLYPCTVTYVEGMKLKNYIARGGGYAARAKKKPFVIYANGLPAAKRGWKMPKVEPGCEIVVPSKGPRGTGMSAAEIMSLSTSAVSLATLVSTFSK